MNDDARGHHLDDESNSADDPGGVQGVVPPLPFRPPEELDWYEVYTLKQARKIVGSTVARSLNDRCGRDLPAWPVGHGHHLDVTLVEANAVILLAEEVGRGTDTIPPPEVVLLPSPRASDATISGDRPRRVRHVDAQTCTNCYGAERRMHQALVRLTFAEDDIVELKEDREFWKASSASLAGLLRHCIERSAQ